jgi:hypothetical protein
MPDTHQASGKAYGPHRIYSQIETQRKGIRMKSYIVLYRIESIMSPLDAPYGFQCWAEDTEHAEEQCMNAYPDGEVVWVALGGENEGDYDYALSDYWDILEDCGK